MNQARTDCNNNRVVSATVSHNIKLTFDMRTTNINRGSTYSPRLIDDVEMELNDILEPSMLRDNRKGKSQDYINGTENETRIGCSLVRDRKHGRPQGNRYVHVSEL